jgi:hypothetical protein
MSAASEAGAVHQAAVPQVSRVNMNWNGDPMLEDILSDSIVKAVMEADGVDPGGLRAMMQEVARGRMAIRWAPGADPNKVPGTARRAASRPV